jgi:hypothetical protein
MCAVKEHTSTALHALRTAMLGLMAKRITAVISELERK